MDLQLNNHVAAIVGGAAGIGLAIARAFLDEQAAVVLIDRSEATVSVAAELDLAYPGRVAGIAADVTDLIRLEAVSAEIMKRFARCDHVVFAAAVGSGKLGFPFWNVPPVLWPCVLDINLTGAAHVAHAFRESLIAAQDGTLLFLASVAGQIGSQTDPPYSASKAGLINFAQCAAKDFAPYGVRVNSICPGMVKTALNESVYATWQERNPETPMTYDAWAADKIKKLVPLNRWQEPEDIAAMAVFLASPRAKNITGQTINVDGGFVMHS